MENYHVVGHHRYTECAEFLRNATLYEYLMRHPEDAILLRVDMDKRHAVDQAAAATANAATATAHYADLPPTPMQVAAAPSAAGGAAASRLILPAGPPPPAASSSPQTGRSLRARIVLPARVSENSEEDSEDEEEDSDDEDWKGDALEGEQESLNQPERGVDERGIRALVSAL